MMDKQKTFQLIDQIVGRQPPMEVQLQVMTIDLLFEIRDLLKPQYNDFSYKQQAKSVDNGK